MTNFHQLYGGFLFLMRTVSIYGLCDPRDQQIKYVGKTVQQLNLRLSQHIHHYGVKRRTKNSCWIEGLLKEQIIPEIFEIERTDESNWVDAEQFWISYFKSIGANIKNISTGGLGSSGYKLSDGHKAKISAWSYSRKHSIETIEKMRLKATGIKKPWVSERNKKHAKISNEEAIAIFNSKESLASLAKQYDVCKVTIWNIKSGKRKLHDI